MANSTWQALEALLDPVLLTVQAQALPPNDTGEEPLIWDIFAPRQDVDSVDLASVTAIDYRPAADRREWNARGRTIPTPTPARRNVSIVPIESNFKVDEQEMQRLSERAGGNAQTVRDLVGVSLPKRIDALVRADYRRLELDFIKAWTTGTIVQRNPENAAQTYTASFGFSGSRYVTAGTAWNDAGVNAYDLLLAAHAAAELLVGPVEGFLMRQATYNVVLADAPNLPNSVRMTRAALNQRISDDLGKPFEIMIDERSMDIFDDGGTAYTRTKVWPAQKVAAIPAGKKIGTTAFAPVVRAMELAQRAPEAGIDVNGVTVYHEISGNGRHLTVEAQLNALTVPDEGKVYVIDAGV